MEFNSINAMHTLAVSFPAFLFALCFHEWAHGWTAGKFGDDTAKHMGRLTLNPAAHIDIVGTLVLPIAGMLFGGFVFGWAKPVPVNPRNLRDPRTQMFWIAFAGPLSNVLMGTIGAVFYAAVVTGLISFGGNFVVESLRQFVLINAMLAVFNMIPIHPLDGGKVLARFLPDKINETLEANQAQSGFVILAILMLGGMGLLWNGPILGLAGLMASFGGLLVNLVI